MRMPDPFADIFIEHLSKGDASAALKLASDDANDSKIDDASSQIILAITEFICGTVRDRDLDFFDTCTNLLDVVTRKIPPLDVLLVIIKEVDSAVDDVKFIGLLQPLGRAVVQLLPTKRISYLAWCFNAIQTYVNELPLPENSDLEGGEKHLTDADSAAMRISELYHDLLPFYDPIVKRISELDLSDCRILLVKFLLQLLGKPLAYLDLDWENGPKSKARLVAEKLMRQIAGLYFDVYQFFGSSFNDETDDIQVDDLALSVFYYLLLGEQVCIETAPNLYEPVFVFQSCLRFVVELFSHDNRFVTENGLKLATALLKTVSGRSLSYRLLDSDAHCKLCKGLANIMVYSPVEAHRKSSLRIFRTYLYQFDTRGRYLLIYNITDTMNYTGLNSYIITQYKEMMVEELDKTESISEYFGGAKLLALLKMFCKLPDGVESDLMKSSDQIIASVNLLRYLAIRDKNNVTKIWDHFKLLETHYLEPLRKGLTLSRGHYDLKVKEVTTENAHGDQGESKSEVSVTIGGRDLPELSTKEKLQVLNSSLTALDVMESLLCRLSECIESGNV